MYGNKAEKEVYINNSILYELKLGWVHIFMCPCLLFWFCKQWSKLQEKVSNMFWVMVRSPYLDKAHMVTENLSSSKLKADHTNQ